MDPAGRRGGARREGRADLAARAGISVAQVVDALQKSNANAGGGYIEHQREHFVIGTDGLVFGDNGRLSVPPSVGAWSVC